MKVEYPIKVATFDAGLVDVVVYIHIHPSHNEYPWVYLNVEPRHGEEICVAAAPDDNTQHVDAYRKALEEASVFGNALEEEGVPVKLMSSPGI